ncbi:DNA-binding response regulator [Bacillus sp. HMF5848]|uniref:response regulator transcription factor n=1 Tax=Bacillus sp. HMF5848 TaxID=2495421 RepID=UPI000F7A9240|nr:response regulator transcription factor [Bacillus sp. HMF5848]RSK26053.1 DNA-binding response regulator [Bacillus sp. HMF5848]
MRNHIVYLVDDEINLNQILTTYLQKEGWQVKSFFDGESALTAISEKPDLWILDIMLPDIDGFSLLKEIKKSDPNVPIIFISARDEDLDRILGLELGSDDYLAKPFLPRELVIRAKKILERVYKHDNTQQEQESTDDILHLEPYTIHINKRLVYEKNTNIELTSKEFDLLLVFAKNLSQAFSREQLLYKIWGDDYFGSDRVVDDLVRRLRKRLPELRIETIYGYGYRMMKL